MKKLFVDDIRMPPADDWIIARTADEAIQYMKLIDFDVISFDHDLGDDSKSGYDVILWLEEECYMNGKAIPSSLLVHSMNPVGVSNIRAAIQSLDNIRSINNA